jgi:hypothetical protein
MGHLVYTVRYPVVPINYSLLTTSLHSLRTTQNSPLLDRYNPVQLYMQLCPSFKSNTRLYNHGKVSIPWFGSERSLFKRKNAASQSARWCGSSLVPLKHARGADREPNPHSLSCISVSAASSVPCDRNLAPTSVPTHARFL